MDGNYLKDYFNSIKYENKEEKTNKVSFRLSDNEVNKIRDIVDRKIRVYNDNGDLLDFDRDPDVVRFLIDSFKGKSDQNFKVDSVKKERPSLMDEAELLATRKYYNYQLRRIGITLNQLNKKTNVTGFDPDELRNINDSIDSIKREIEKTGVFDDK